LLSWRIDSKPNGKKSTVYRNKTSQEVDVEKICRRKKDLLLGARKRRGRRR
jgi:hypothetical protein